MLSPGYKTVLRAKLAHIALKAGQGFYTCPACPREFLAPFLHHDSFFRPTRRFVTYHGRDPLPYSRLSWAERLARNAHPTTAGRVTIKLFGIPESFAVSLGLATA